MDWQALSVGSVLVVASPSLFVDRFASRLSVSLLLSINPNPGECQAVEFLESGGLRL